METIARFGSDDAKRRWLKPLLDGAIRSAFAMTEPDVASSDATNIAARIERDGDDYVINGRKWWISGAGDPRCAIYIVMGKTDPNAAAPFPAEHGAGAGQYAGHHGAAPAARDGLRRCAARPHGDRVRERARAG
jgi:alkylation response protein AidB-like acyl-CoA dehydrogenase